MSDKSASPDPEQIISVIVYVLVGVVAAFAFVVSYAHIYDLARQHGQHGIAAKGTPLSVDLLIVAASLIMYRQGRKAGQLTWPARILPRVMLYAGIAATIAANVAYGYPFGPLGAVISAWPGAVFAGLAETVMVTVRPSPERRSDAVKQTVIPAGQTAIPTTAYDAALAAHVASVKGGNPLGEYQLAKRFGIPRSQARKICTPAVPELAAASMNGNGS